MPTNTNVKFEFELGPTGLYDMDEILDPKTLKAERDFLKRNLNTTVANIITILIKINKNKLEDLSKFTGIDKEELNKHIDKNGLVTA